LKEVGRLIAARPNSRSAGKFSTVEELVTTGESIGFTIGVSYKAIVESSSCTLQSDRGLLYKVIVENFVYPQWFVEKLSGGGSD